MCNEVMSGGIISARATLNTIRCGDNSDTTSAIRSPACSTTWAWALTSIPRKRTVTSLPSARMTVAERTMPSDKRGTTEDSRAVSPEVVIEGRFTGRKSTSVVFHRTERPGLRSSNLKELPGGGLPRMSRVRIIGPRTGRQFLPLVCRFGALGA